MHSNKKTSQKIAFTFLLSLQGFSINGMWAMLIQKNQALINKQKTDITRTKLLEIKNRKIMPFENTNELQTIFFYTGFIEGLMSYNPEQRYSKEETVIHDHEKNAFILYDENLKSTDITDEIINKLLILKICLQVNKLSYSKLKPAYNNYIKHIFENFLFDQDRYAINQKINYTIGKNTLGKDIQHNIKKTVINAIKEKDFSSTNRILFDILVYGTTQWYVDHKEKIVVSTWGEAMCKDALFQLIQENNPHITHFLKTVTNNIPKDYCYLIGINFKEFTITPDMYTHFKKEGMSIRKDEGYLLSSNPANDHKALFKSLSIKALANT